MARFARSIRSRRYRTRKCGLHGELRTRAGTSVKCLEFTILTAARTEESIGAKWPEIDFGAQGVDRPARTDEGGREHRVPLSDAAMAVLSTCAAYGRTTTCSR